MHHYPFVNKDQAEQFAYIYEQITWIVQMGTSAFFHCPLSGSVENRLIFGGKDYMINML